MGQDDLGGGGTVAEFRGELKTATLLALVQAMDAQPT